MVVCAMPNEPDHVWLTRAKLLRADVVMSPDLGVRDWAEREGMAFVRLNGNRRGPKPLSLLRAARRRGGW